MASARSTTSIRRSFFTIVYVVCTIARRTSHGFSHSLIGQGSGRPTHLNSRPPKGITSYRSRRYSPHDANSISNISSSSSSSSSSSRSTAFLRLQSSILSPTAISISSISSFLPETIVVPPTDLLRTALGLLLARRLSSSGLRKRSLSRSGAISAFLVSSLSLSTSFRNGITLFSFYWTGSKLTRVGSSVKGTLEEGHVEGGQRGWRQVLACSAIAVGCAVLRKFALGLPDGPLGDASLLADRLTLAYVAFFACCAGDTWASELGILAKSPPRSIVRPWRAVPPGTNGGVSGVGLLASAAGGTAMGLLHGVFVPGGMASLVSSLWGTGRDAAAAVPASAFRREIVLLTFVGVVGGLGGSLLDSFLGATVQATYYDREQNRIVKRPGPNVDHVGGWSFLSNEMVNVVSTAVTALMAALLAKPILNLI
ncbi:hypothetical protein ACHAXS_007096 [Conticribra weissflogii]